MEQDSRWANIDTALSDVGAILEPKVAAADNTVFDGGDTELVSVAKGDASFGLGWQETLPAQLHEPGDRGGSAVRQPVPLTDCR
ncbi:hypothetical protein [Streptomyces microflavus]|uniref:hypothetical protein n=1 Tax=Streptomyces microflavus TaxID=1919 RepID=UPI003823EA3B